MTIRRMNRDRRLTPEEAAKYLEIREQVAGELPDLISRHHDRVAAYEQFAELLQQLRAAREQQGLSLAELTELTGMDRSARSKPETGQRPNPTLETLIRYAEAVGKRLVVSLADADAPKSRAQCTEVRELWCVTRTDPEQAEAVSRVGIVRNSLFFYRFAPRTLQFSPGPSVPRKRSTRAWI